MIPDKIYLVQTTRIIDEWRKSPSPLATNFEYIRKDALLEWAKEQEENTLIELISGLPIDGKLSAFKRIIDKLNSM